MDDRVYIGIAEGHADPSAAAVRNGSVIAYAEEERFLRNKHAFGTYPINALKYCLDETGAELENVHAVCVGWDLDAYRDGRMRRIFDEMKSEWRVDEATIKWQNSMLASFNPENVKARHELQWRRAFGDVRFPPIRHLPHHYTHAFQASMQSPFKSALVLTADGSGDQHTTVLWQKNGSDLVKLREITMPHSLGWFYAAFTEFLGFDAYDGEYKVMGLASHGKMDRSIIEKVRNVIFPGEDGIEYRLNPYYIHYGAHSYSGRFTDLLPELLGRRPRLPSDPIVNWHRNLAFAVQSELEESVCRLVKWGIKETGVRNLCVGGGVALNVKVNQRLLECLTIDDIFAHPLCSDAGAAAGAALGVCNKETKLPPETLYTLAIGPQYHEKVIVETLHAAGVKFSRPTDLHNVIASELADGRIVGWFQGRMEAGPRALGQRSILADPRSRHTADRVNEIIKHREAWRPFAPAILMSAREKYFDGTTTESRFMTITFRANKRLEADAPAVVHVDGTVRAQFVDNETCPDLFALIVAFNECTGVPILLNTSFNVRGEPIVCSPEDAIRTFFGTGIDVLVMGGCVVRKSESVKEGDRAI